MNIANFSLIENNGNVELRFSYKGKQFRVTAHLVVDDQLDYEGYLQDLECASMDQYCLGHDRF